jgi:hypothetical protein
MITKKSIKELVELVEEGKLSEIVFEDEIERVKYVIYKNQIGVGIQKTDMDKKEEPVKPYRKTILESPSNPILEKAMDYLMNPYPKVNDSILEMYKSTLSDELDRITEIGNRIAQEAEKMSENLKVQENLENSVQFRDERQKLIKHMKFELVQRRLAGEDIRRIKSVIKDFINHDK